MKSDNDLISVSQCFFAGGWHFRYGRLEPFFVELIQRTLLLQVGDGFIDLLLQFFVVFIEAKGEVLDFGVRHIDHAEIVLAVCRDEVVCGRFVEDARLRTACFEFHHDIRCMVEAADLHALILGIVRGGRTHLYGDFGAVLHVFDRVDRAVLRGHARKLCRIEGGGEEDLAGSLFRGCQAGSRHVDFMRLQRRDESVKCNVLEFYIAA